MRDQTLLPESAPDNLVRAVAAMTAGSPIVLIDDVSGTGEGDLVLRAEGLTTPQMAFMVRHSAGFVCAALPEQDCDRLQLPPMQQQQSTSIGANQRVSVDALSTGTGISAEDRARTIARLAAPEATATDFSRPGHVIVVATTAAGLLSSTGRAEAAVDLARLAGGSPVAAFSGLVSATVPTSMADTPELIDFAHAHGLPAIGVSQIVQARLSAEPQVRREAVTTMPTPFGRFRVHGYRDLSRGSEHLALVAEANCTSATTVFVQNECSRGHIFGDPTCGCAARLERMMRSASACGGVVIYLRGVGGCMEAQDDVSTGTGLRISATVENILSDLGVDPIDHRSFVAGTHRYHSDIGVTPINLRTSA